MHSMKPDWESVINHLPHIIIGLDGSGKINCFKGSGKRLMDLEEISVVGRTIPEFFHQFRKFEVRKRNEDGISFFCIEDERIEGGVLELETMEHFRPVNGSEVWIFRDRTAQRTLDRFLDSYHDNVEQELSRIVFDVKNALEKLTIALVTALENANLVNDNETGNHILRVSEYSALLSEKLGYGESFVKRIKLYAPLHDVGKVGIPGSLLKKPGIYTREEHLLMQEHVVIGARMLAYPEIDSMARNIALYHHEKWDGTGYVTGLRGTEIPREAQIVALADVYDALHSPRVYKQAYSHETAVKMITACSGTSFEPEIVHAFLENEHAFNAITHRYA